MKPARGSCELLRFVCLLSILAIAKSQSLPCPVGITKLTVSDNTQAVDLADALLCSGGQFEVTWVSEVLLTRTIDVPDGTSLKILGSSFGGSVVDGGAQNQLFNVSGASLLHLQDLSLVNGFSSRGGGAIGLSGSSSLEAVNCSFGDNTAGAGFDAGMLLLRGVYLRLTYCCSLVSCLHMYVHMHDSAETMSERNQPLAVGRWSFCCAPTTTQLLMYF